MRRVVGRERLIGMTVAFVFAFGLSFFSLRWLENAITFHPVGYAAGNEWLVPTGGKDVWFTSSDGIGLHGWLFVPYHTPPVATVIYFHGNGGNITNIGWVGEHLASRGFEVLLFDYRGYGRSEGHLRDESGLYRDADAAYDFAVQKLSANKLVLYGQSLGTAAVVDVASRRRANAIILESGLSSASDVAAMMLPWFPRSLHFLLKNRFDSAEKIRRVMTPILITHGDPDPVIPTDLSRRLFAAANEPKKLVIVPGVGHNVFGSAGKSYLDLVVSFITNAVASDVSQKNLAATDAFSLSES